MRQLILLALLGVLSLVMLYPLSLKLSHMVAEPTDPLLNAWRLQWNIRAFLSGPAGIANLFNTNIFYPFPLTLAYSEHFLMPSALALPFLLLAESHLVGLNLSVLVTFILSGYAMYLLVADWTGSRQAGLVAGLLFAFSPHRFGQLNHLELLVTQWLPLALLALHWLLTRPGYRYAVLFGLLVNFQALSGFHFTFNLVIACALLVLVYALAGRIYWRWGLGLALALTASVTMLLNWPIWRTYLYFSDVMGAVRTPGEVRVYSAAFTDYLTTIPHNWLYGWTFGHWPASDHQFQPLMPFGLTGLLLAILGLALATRRRLSPPPTPALPQGGSNLQPQTSNLKPQNSKFKIQNFLLPTLIFCLLLALVSLLLSFGLNENALGEGLAPLLSYSPYTWLYEHTPFFRGIRVPGRFGILVVVSLVGLAGWGVAWLVRLVTAYGRRQARRQGAWLAAGLTGGLAALVLLESWSVPLVGPEFPAGSDIPPVYAWLREATPTEAVVLELPYQDASEFSYEYYSSYHWRHLANGGTGYTPPIYKELRRWFTTFPDTRSVDLIQQLGIDVVILHQASYPPEAWQQLQAELPLYLPAFSEIRQIGPDLVLRVARPSCRPQAEAVSVALAPAAGPDGLAGAVKVTYANAGPAAFVADVRQVSRLSFNDRPDKNFIEPLAVPAGEAQSVLVPLDPAGKETTPSLSGATLATLGRAISASGEVAAPPPTFEPAWQPLGLAFADGPRLLAYSLGPEPPAACGHLAMALQWEGGQAGDTALVQLLDPFGRLVAEDKAQPWAGGSGADVRALPLPGSLPAGRYGLRIRVRPAEGQERLPVTEAGVTIPPDQIPPLPVTIHPGLPAPVAPDHTLARFQPGIRLLTGILASDKLAAGEWLRFTLTWQADGPVEQNWTVFTQLLGPDGQVWGQQDHQPKGGWYSTSLWLPGRPVTDDYAFPLPADAPAGAYRLVAGLYDGTTMARVPVDNGADFVEIGQIEIGK